MVLPTRVERPDEGGGWELLEDVYSKRIDFNQTGFTLHQVDESDPHDAKTAVGSQPPGSQGPPLAVVEPTHAVDVEYTNIRCLKRGAKLRARAYLDMHALTISLRSETTDAQVIWTIGLNKPLSDDDDDEFELSKDAIAARASALKAMTTSAAAITLKFPLVDAASLEACVMPLIFEHNPVRHCSMHTIAALWLTCVPPAQGVHAEQPKLAAMKMSHATLVQGKSAMDSQQPHGGGGSLVRHPACACYVACVLTFVLDSLMMPP